MLCTVRFFEHPLALYIITSIARENWGNLMCPISFFTIEKQPQGQTTGRRSVPPPLHTHTHPSPAWYFTYSVEQYWHLNWLDLTLLLHDLPHSNSWTRCCSFLLVKHSNSSTSVIVTGLVPDFTTCYRPVIPTSNIYHWTTNCRTAISLCPGHFPGLPPQTAYRCLFEYTLKLMRSASAQLMPRFAWSDM